MDLKGLYKNYITKSVCNYWSVATCGKEMVDSVSFLESSYINWALGMQTPSTNKHIFWMGKKDFFIKVEAGKILQGERLRFQYSLLQGIIGYNRTRFPEGPS